MCWIKVSVNSMTLCRWFKRTILGKYNINSTEHIFFYRNTVESIYTDMPENLIILALKNWTIEKIIWNDNFISERSIVDPPISTCLYHWIILLEVSKGLVISPFICSFHWWYYLEYYMHEKNNMLSSLMYIWFM